MPVDLPTSLPPSRDDKATFAQRGNDAWAHLFAAWPQLNALEANVNTKEASATTSAGTATTKAGEALTSANAASTSNTNAGLARDAAVVARTGAEAALDSFDDRYLGAKAADPTLDNDGAALLVGALYWSTAIPGMRAYTGTAWTTLPAATAGAVANTPAGGVTELNVQGAINGLEARKAKAGANSDITGLTGLSTLAVSALAGQSCIIASKGSTTGYGAFYAENSGSGPNYIFFGDAGGEKARITAQTDGAMLLSGGHVLVTSPAGLGYGYGSGGTVTQATSKATTVTLNKPTGRITTAADALAGLAAVTFLLNNTLINVADLVVVHSINTTNYRVEVGTVIAGAVYIRITNVSGASISEALAISFAIIKGSTA